MTLDRKKDHIELADASQTSKATRDLRFNYEPLLATHPPQELSLFQYFLGKAFNAPIWVSSMTGGTTHAKKINQNLARACGDFGLGMGLGSCRKLLDDDEYLEDFRVRHLIKDQPLYANLGIVQIEELVLNKKTDKIRILLKKLEADGLIVHVNPVQEWLQPEGDRLNTLTSYQAIEGLLEAVDCKIVVKEVGQGMGPESLEAILRLPIDALEFGAFGGTNFAKLESLRAGKKGEIDPICMVGHTPLEMISYIEKLHQEDKLTCKEFIISGGVSSYLDGYFYNESLSLNSLYGQAGPFLAHARGDYDALAQFVQNQIDGYKFALRFLRLK